MARAVIVGTGGHAQVLWAAWQMAHRTDPGAVIPVIGWLESASYQGPDTLLEWPVYRENAEGWAALQAQGVTHAYLGIGMIRANPSRWSLAERLGVQGLQLATLIHPTAVVDPTACIEAGCYVGARAVIQPFAHLYEAAIVNTGAIVEHHAQVGRNVHVAPGAVLCGETAVGDHSLVGAGAVVIQGIAVGASATVGAGSVVIADVPAGATAVGNPACARAPMLAGEGA